MPRVLKSIAVLSLLGLAIIAMGRRPLPPATAASPKKAAEARQTAPPAALPIVAHPSAERGRFTLRDGPVSAFFGEDGLVLSLSKRAGKAASGLFWNLVGARRVEPRPEARTSARVRTLSRDRAVDSPGYSRVVYDQVRPGVDLVVESRPKGLKYTLLCAAGTSGSIPIRYEGAREIRALRNGAALEIATDAGVLREDGLVCWQEGPRGRTSVPARYVASGGDGYSIELGEHDPSRPVVVDPVISWATYLGGTEHPFTDEEALAVDVDPAGNVYVSGWTSAIDFPTTPGSFPSEPSGFDGFVSKFSPSGELLWSTLMRESIIKDLAVDAAGQAVMTGFTHDGFPLRNAFDETYEIQEGFVAQFNVDGSDLLWATYIGGNGIDSGTSVAFDAAGNVLVCGYTDSTDLPAVSGVPGGNLDGFAAKISPGGASLLWVAYLGGEERDSADAIAADPAGNVYVTGTTASAGFPVTPGAFQSSYGGGGDAFLVKLSPTGGLSGSTYLGRDGSDYGTSVAIDPSGHAYVAADGSLPEDPSLSVYQPAGPGTFIVKMDLAGTTPVWAVALGGSSSDFIRGLHVDAAGEVTVTGATWSEDFPILAPVQAELNGPSDAFLTRMAADGQSLLWSTFFGGSDQELAWALAPAPGGGFFVVGHTKSGDLPTSSGAFSPSLTGMSDAFVARLELEPVLRVPYALEQRSGDDGALIPVGGAARVSLDLSAAVGGLEVAHYVEFEIVPVDTPFTGESTYASNESDLPPGSVANVSIIGFTPNVAYQWRARQITASGGFSAWVSFGGNLDNPPASPADADFVFEPTPVAAAPFALAQRGQDGSTIPVGGAAPSVVFLSAVIGGSEDAWLEIEARPVDAPFTGVFDYLSDLIAPGSEAGVSALFQDGTAYQWRVRQVTTSGLASPWVSFGGNAENPPASVADTDFIVNPPLPPPTALAQTTFDGAPLAIGAWAAQGVALSAAVAPDAWLEIEVRPLGEAFSGIPTSVGAPGSADAHVYDTLLESGVAYRWQARQVNVSGTSAWASFGGNDEEDADFRVDREAPAILVTRPRKDQRTWGTATARVEGAADDDVQLAAVLWTNLATGESGVAEGTAAWVANVPLAHGMNEIRVSAVDHVGNTSVSTLLIRRP